MTSIRRTPLHAVRVTAITALTPRMRRITLTGPSLTGLAVTPAQDIEVVLPDGSGHGLGHRVTRRYTIRRARPEAGELDVDALIHPHGPGGRWAGAVEVGAEVEFFGPRGHLEVRPAGWHLFVGDEAGLPAVAAVIEALPDTEPAIVLAEVNDESDMLELGPATVHWLYRRGAAPGRTELFAGALGALGGLTSSPDGRAYLLGESRAMVALRPLLVALGVPPERAYVKGYWNLGRLNRRVPV